MAENYTHWRNLTDLAHLRAEVFAPGEEKVLTIKNVVTEDVVNNNGAISKKPVAYFVEPILPMVLNTTNCKVIEKIYNSGNIYDWVGKKVQVFTTTTKVAGQSVPCLRIRNYIPKTSEPEYKCSVCGKTITKQVYDGSIAKYGKAYCSKECLDVAKNGEKVDL